MNPGGNLPPRNPEPIVQPPLGRLASNAPAAAVGVGLGVIIQSVLQSQPEVMQQMVGWGPGIAVLAGFVWMAQKFVPPFIATQERMASNVGLLAGSLQVSLSRDDDVRMAMNTLSGQVREMLEEVRKKQ